MELHNLYYNYLKQEINNLNYLDYSTKVDYSHHEPLTFTKTEETDQGIFGTLTAETSFEYKADELVIMRIEDKDRLIEYEIQEKLNDNKLKVFVLNDAKDTDNYSFNNWTYKKNILDNIDANLYPDGNDFTIVGDGYHFSNIEIKNGKIELPVGVYIGNFRIGYNYSAMIKTLPLGGQLDSFNAMIAKKNIIKVYLRLYNSWGGKFGTDYYNLKDINYLKLQYTRFNEPYTLQEQDVKIDSSDKWEFTKSYYIIQDYPYPFNINSITLLEDQN